MKLNKITCIGEVLIDWTCLDKTLDLNKANDFIKAPGGAPANVAVALAKVSKPVQFLGGFSTDLFGGWLKSYLTQFGVDVSAAPDVPKSNTRSAYVLTDEKGNRVFKGFSNESCADVMIDFNMIDMDDLKNSSMIYFGSLLQSQELTRNTIAKVLEFLGTDNSKYLKVYDPNLRMALWPDVDTAMGVIKKTIKKVDILKLSDDEIDLVTGIKDNIEAAAQKVFETYDNIKLLVVTMGPNGSYFINKNGKGFVKPFKVDSVEMTGAGDAFVAGLLGGLHDFLSENNGQNGNLAEILETLSAERLQKILTSANAMGALATTKPGAMSALPTTAELDKFLAIKA